MLNINVRSLYFLGILSVFMPACVTVQKISMTQEEASKITSSEVHTILQQKEIYIPTANSPVLAASSTPGGVVAISAAASAVGTVNARCCVG